MATEKKNVETILEEIKNKLDSTDSTDSTKSEKNPTYLNNVDGMITIDTNSDEAKTMKKWLEQILDNLSVEKINTALNKTSEEEAGFDPVEYKDQIDEDYIKDTLIEMFIGEEPDILDTTNVNVMIFLQKMENNEKKRKKQEEEQEKERKKQEKEQEEEQEKFLKKIKTFNEKNFKTKIKIPINKIPPQIKVTVPTWSVMRKENRRGYIIDKYFGLKYEDDVIKLGAKSEIGQNFFTYTGITKSEDKDYLQTEACGKWILEQVEGSGLFEEAMKRNEKEGEYNLMQRFKGKYEENKDYIEAINKMAKELRAQEFKTLQADSTKSEKKLEKYLKYLRTLGDKINQFITFVFKKKDDEAVDENNNNTNNYEMNLSLKF